MKEGGIDRSHDRTGTPRASAQGARGDDRSRPAVSDPVQIIKDLTAKLAAVAEEFSGRAAAISVPAANSPNSQPNDLSARLNLARRLIKQRRERSRHLPEELFHEPAWDMLLALYLAWHEGQTLFVKTLVATCSAPITTSQRWIEHMAKLGLVTRVADLEDRRRIEVSLSQAGLQALDEYLSVLQQYP